MDPAARTDFLEGKRRMLMSNPTIRAPVPVVIVALDPGGRALMTRDMELIRNILAQIKSRNTLDYQPIEIPDVDAAILARHVELLHQAHLIEALRSDPLNSPHPLFTVKDLTWDGHDFAAAVGNDTVWSTIRQKLSPKELAGLPLGIIKDLAMGILSHQIKSMFGL
jgi:hypothetical protein